MKGMKKFITCLLTAALTLGATSAVFAASKTTDVTSPTGGIIVAALDTTGLDADVVEAIEDVTEKTDLDAFLEDIDGQKGAEDVKEALTGKKFLTGFFDVYAEKDAKPNADGTYTVKLNVPALKAGMTGIKVLHYSTVRGIWEVIDVDDVDYTNQLLTATFKDLSPVTIVIAKSSSSNKDTTNKTAQTTTKKTAPKTGASTNYMVWMVAAMAFIGAAFAVSRKKAAM
uniref:LPXTG cell wall anchor domain-containing protein n=1 Tax=Eubacterium cellulosolvens TaxID=29322 RepID=UPI000687B2C7|nr:LPXTG cell wall anchor domain-containing protein [[Eubacterium] cellulosolvens]